MVSGKTTVALVTGKAPGSVERGNKPLSTDTGKTPGSIVVRQVPICLTEGFGYSCLLFSL